MVDTIGKNKILDESDIQYWNLDYFKQYYPEELLTIISKYNSKKHLRVKVKNIPFEFSDSLENESSEKIHIV